MSALDAIDEAPGLLDRAFVEGRATYGVLALDAAAFRARVADVAARHWRARGTEPTPERVRTFLERAALPDLYLAAACEAGDSRAWDVLADRLRPRLEAFARRRGAAAAQAESVVQDLLGDLAAPPPRGGARTLLGLFDASGSLYGWLAIVLLRRMAASARGRRPVSLETQEDDVLETVVPASRRASVPAGPDASAAGSESAARFEEALERGWETLSDQERLAVLFKHRDGLMQKRVADLLGVGEPRVSRIVSSAVAKLSAALHPVVGRALPDEAGLVARMADALSRRMARTASSSPPREGRAGGPGSPGPGAGRGSP